MSFEMKKVEEGKEGVENLELKYIKAENWEELYKLIRGTGTVETSAGKKDSEKIINKIEGIKKAVLEETIDDNVLEIILRDITRTDGLRDKVKELIKAESKN